MSAKTPLSPLVPRTCTLRQRSGTPPVIKPLAEYRDTPAYVLLGDPGAGKTKSFEQEAQESGGHYISARDFAELEENLAGKVLFIDGLDEMRAGSNDQRTPLGEIRRHLARLGKPSFRLSCREADWLGDSDKTALKKIAPDGEIKVLHLDPLSEDDIHYLLEHKFEVADPETFVRDAERHGLDSLLRNPQTLELMVEAVAGPERPDSRGGVYEFACRKLVREPNKEHQTARRARPPSDEDMLEAAGFLGAVQLLTGLAGVTLDENAKDKGFAILRTLTTTTLSTSTLQAATGTRLFQRGDDEQKRVFVHRSIAEFLGARYLRAHIEIDGLPVGRVIALLAGEDGGVVPELRGLAAWLAAHCRTAREVLIERDPLGIVLYGDVSVFTVEDKLRVLSALKTEAERYAHFRSEDWTAAPFGALFSREMVPTFLKLLTSPARTDADIALVDCALDALLFGPPLSDVASPDDLQRMMAVLNGVARDANHRTHIRSAALEVLLRDLAHSADALVAFAGDLRSGAIQDPDDELLGQLLVALFPKFMKPHDVFDYLRPAKQHNVIGNHHMFWVHHLPEEAPAEVLPTLLDELVRHGPTKWESDDDFLLTKLAGVLLARGLEENGDIINDAQLYDWLGTGLNEYGTPRLQPDEKARICAWLQDRPERYKAILQRSVESCAGQENISSRLFLSADRLFEATPPADIVPWLLHCASDEDRPELKHHYFSSAIRQLIRDGGQQYITADALDYLAPWISRHPEFEVDLEPFVSCSLNDWRRDNMARRRAGDARRAKRMNEWRTFFREHLDSIRNGRAPPHVFDALAKVCLRRFKDISGGTSHERLEDFLDGDDDLINAAYAGFRRVLDREDLPTVAEIVRLETKGQMHFIRQPCLVGLTKLFADDPASALTLDEALLRRLIAFRLTWGTELEGDWLASLVEARPALVADVLATYALAMLRAGHDHVYGIWQLAYDDNNMAELARCAVPRMLEGFPRRAKEKLLLNALDPLLKAGLRHLDRTVMADIVSARLARGSMTATQRTYWLACGLMMSPDDYAPQLKQHVGRREALLGHLGNFLAKAERWEKWADLTNELSLPAIGMLIEMLAPNSPPERPEGAHWVSQAMQVAGVVRGFINTLGNDPSEGAGRELDQLLAQPGLTPWHGRLRHSKHAWRIARRKATFRRLDINDVCRTLVNREPANAADLAALTFAHLEDLARRIRDGSTNDYRQYWSYNKVGNPEHPKPENDCRDALLSDLKDRLAKQGVDAIKEGYYAEDKRADIRVSMGGASGFNVPIEIKKDAHKDLWRAIREQLIERYTRDPGADGFGIYLVFWFGGSGMPLNEGKKPRTAVELKEQLRASLTDQEARRISVVVVDCALPASKK